MPRSLPTPAAESAAPAPPARFAAIHSARAFESIAEQIRHELIHGRLTVGSRLPPERALAGQFGVSRNTLREALRSLEHAGLVQLRKGASGGAFISRGAEQAIATGLLDMYHVGTISPAQLTQAIEWYAPLAVREACLSATDDDLAEIDRHLHAADAAGEDAALRVTSTIALHRVLARLAGNPIATAVLNGVLDVLGHHLSLHGTAAVELAHPARRRFVRQLQQGEADAAVAELQASIRRARRRQAAAAAAAVPPRRAADPTRSPARRRHGTANASAAR